MLRPPQVNSGFPLTRSAELPYLLVTLFPQKLPSGKHLFITCVLTVRQDIHTCISWTARPMLWGFACCSESGPHRRCSASVHSRLKTKAPYCHSPIYSPSSHVVPATLAYPCSGIWAAIERERGRYNKENPLSLSSPGLPGM